MVGDLVRGQSPSRVLLQKALGTPESATITPTSFPQESIDNGSKDFAVGPLRAANFEICIFRQTFSELVLARGTNDRIT